MDQFNIWSSALRDQMSFLGTEAEISILKIPWFSCSMSSLTLRWTQSKAWVECKRRDAARFKWAKKFWCLETSSHLQLWWDLTLYGSVFPSSPQTHPVVIINLSPRIAWAYKHVSSHVTDSINTHKPPALTTWSACESSELRPLQSLSNYIRMCEPFRTNSGRARLVDRDFLARYRRWFFLIR